MSLIAALEARLDKRPNIEVPLSEIIQHDAPAGSIRMRALTVQEESEATEAAVAFRKRALSALPERHAQAFLDDPSFLEDAKHVERLYRSCRDAEDVRKLAFPDSDSMRRVFTVDEMRRLSEWFGRVERLNAKVPDTMTDEQRMSIVDACAMMSSTNYPDRCLDALPHWVVKDLFVWLSAKHKSGPDQTAEQP